MGIIKHFGSEESNDDEVGPFSHWKEEDESSKQTQYIEVPSKQTKAMFDGDKLRAAIDCWRTSDDVNIEHVTGAYEFLKYLLKL